MKPVNKGSEIFSDNEITSFVRNADCVISQACMTCDGEGVVHDDEGMRPCSACQDIDDDAAQEAADSIDARRYRDLKRCREVMLLTGLFGNGCINKTLADFDAEIDKLATT